MKIHTDLIFGGDLIRACANHLDGVYVEYVERGSRSKACAFDITLTAEPRKGRRLSNSGTRGAARVAAATWDEWGIFIDELFRIDPNAVIGPYCGYADFRQQTGSRYDTRDFTPCDQHKWSWGGAFSDGSLTCAKGCGAVRRASLRTEVTV